MNIDEVLIFSGIIMVLMLIFIVAIFFLFTKKTIESIRQRREFDFKMQQAIILSQESEREVLAINIHDDLGPQLSFLYRQLQKDIDSNSSITFSSAERGNIYKKLDELISDVRKFSSDIYPTQLKEMGLIQALEQNLFDMHLHIRIRFFNHLETNLNFDNSKQLAVYRITNEVLNNILRHGKPTFIDCEVNGVDDHLQIVFTHDGVPFSQQEFLDLAQSQNGRGCSSILNRTLLLEGTVEFYHILDQFACVNIRIPMPL